MSGHVEPTNSSKKRKANEMEDWREMTEKMTIVEQLRYMLKNNIFTDCTFVVGPEDGETREFKAHRVYVARASAVFEAMLMRGEMTEAKTGHVRITDLSPNTFRLLLSSVYGKEPVMNTFQEAQDLAFAADKYQMNLLLETCGTRMGALITPVNVWTGLKTANLLRNEHLKEKCVEVLQRDTLQCITDPGFMQTSEENVALLLEQDEMNMDDELLLVNTIVQWARRAAIQRGLYGDDSGVRAVLEPRLLSLFRFLAMSPQQFMLGPGLAGWLTDDEKFAIDQCRVTAGYFDKLPPFLSSVTENRKKAALTTPSQINVASRKICKRNIIESGPNVKLVQSYNCCKISYNGRSLQNILCLHGTLIFRVNSNCKWLGFQCASRKFINLSTDPTLLLPKYPYYMENLTAKTYTYNQSLSSKSKKVPLRREKTYHQDTGHYSNISVMFDGEPIYLSTGKWYVLEVAFKQELLDGVVPAEYPNPSRATNVCTESGVEFIFRTERLEGYYTSMCDGIFEGIIFAV